MDRIERRRRTDSLVTTLIVVGFAYLGGRLAITLVPVDDPERATGNIVSPVNIFFSGAIAGGIVGALTRKATTRRWPITRFARETT